MVRKTDKDVIVGLDIGTSKVLALVGEITPDDGIEVIGMGSQPSRGLKKGVVVNIESTVQSIQRAIEEAELRPSARSAPSTPASPAATCAASIHTAWSRSAIARSRTATSST